MDFYYAGHMYSDAELYKEILHDKWSFFYIKEDKLRIVYKPEYLSWYDPQKVDKSLKWEIEFYYIDVTGNMGAAKIRMECQKVRYIDYFNLVKTENKWWIVNKLSHYDIKPA